MKTKEEIIARIFRERTPLEVEARNLLQKATGRVMSFRENGSGCVEIFSDLKRDSSGYSILGALGKTSILAHRAIFFEAYPETYTGLHVLHKCDNPACCRLSHLFAGTSQDNMNDKSAKSRGNSLCGVYHPNSKLTREQVCEIKEASKRVKNSVLATKYGISNQHISDIRRGKRQATTVR